MKKRKRCKIVSYHVLSIDRYGDVVNNSPWEKRMNADNDFNRHIDKLPKDIKTVVLERKTMYPESLGKSDEFFMLRI